MFCWRRILHIFGSHLKLIQLQKMDLQVVRQGKVCRHFLQPKVEMRYRRPASVLSQ